MVESFGFSLPVVVLNLFEIIATLESFANIFQFHAIFGSWREGSTDGVKRIRVGKADINAFLLHYYIGNSEPFLSLA